MKSKLFSLVVILVAVASGLLVDVQSQTRNRNSAPAASTLMSSHPQSEAVVHVKLKQLLNEAMPQILANNPNKLSEVSG